MKTILKVIVFLVLVVALVEFTTKGEEKAFGGLLVKMGIVDSAGAPTLKQRVEGNLEKARHDEARRYGQIDEAARSGD
ncbi:MAG: hypothetical protein ACE5FC_05735 [Myxococcota bacterium]